MSDPVTAVIRTPDGVRVRRVRRQGDLRPAELDKGPLAVDYLEYEATLDELGPSVLPHQRRLAEAFADLADAAPADSGTFERALLVTLLTVPRAGDVDRLPALPPAREAVMPRRTAAHPRGYRGTKQKPRKPAGPRRSDLRRALCSRKQTRELLTAGWPARHEVVPRLATRLELPAAGLERLTAPTVPADPFVAAWFPDETSANRLEAAFVEDLLECCRGLPWEIVRALQGLYRRWRLGHEPRLRAVIAGLLATAATRQTASWLLAAERWPPESRHGFLTLVAETDAYRLAPPPDRLLRAMSEVVPADRERRWTFRVLRALGRSVDADYLEAGVRLASVHEPSYGFWRIEPCAGFARKPLDAALARLPSPAAAELALPLWQAVGMVPGLMAHLATGPLDSLPADAPAADVLPAERCAAYIRFLAELRWHGDPTSMDKRCWRAVEPFLPAVRRLLGAVPAQYLDQACCDLGEVLDSWSTPGEIEAFLGDAIALLTRLQIPPIDPDGHLAFALAALLGTQDAQARQRLLQAPLDRFVRLDRACRRKNDASLIAWGLSSLCQHQPTLAADGFDHEPKRLFRLARLLGTLSREDRRRTLAAWRPALCADSDLERVPIEVLVPRVDAALAGTETAVVPRALREHLAGERTLKPQQVDRHRHRVAGALPSIRLAELERHVLARLGRPLAARRLDPGLRFALQMLHDADANRRGLRRFLRAHLRGDTAYLQRHPASRGWLRRHPEVDPARWTAGIETTVEDPSATPITLAVEQDPIEILKMGQHVGSCLGLGGSHSWSAIAVLLDVNKQVIYARDSLGAVVARQLLAISSHQQLVPFAVYPLTAPSWLCAAFRTYDRRLARFLGLPLCTDEDYEIENVLAHDWWDDGFWYDDPSRPAETAPK